MRSRWLAAALCSSAVLAAGAFAQDAHPPATPAPLYDPRQLPGYTGQVQQFTLTPRGDIDGLILSDGTEVKTAPHLSTEIAYSVKPGDTVEIHGLHAFALPLIEAVSLTDRASGRTVIDSGPRAPGPVAPPPPARADDGIAAPLPGLAEAQGAIRMLLHGPQGEVNGVLFEDGTVLRLPPPEAAHFASLLQPRRTIVAEGVELASPIGKVVDVRQIGTSRTELRSVAPPPPGRRPPPPPPQ